MKSEGGRERERQREKEREIIQITVREREHAASSKLGISYTCMSHSAQVSRCSCTSMYPQYTKKAFHPKQSNNSLEALETPHATIFTIYPPLLYSNL